MHAIDAVAFGVLNVAILVGLVAFGVSDDKTNDVEFRNKAFIVFVACVGLVASSAWWLWAS